MKLPIDIDAILKGRLVESERLEFKEGWNPEKVIHALCAFANDFHNLGGGYIFIGIKEKNGRPVLPPAGLDPDQLDHIQQEVVRLGHLIRPDYHPVMAPYEYQGKHILVLWATGGQTRPYKAPVSLSEKRSDCAHYIRRGSITAKVTSGEERELFSMAATVPFDDRPNHQATLDDLDLNLIQAFLRKAGSGLYEESRRLAFPQLCRQMNIIAGSDEYLQPRNVGLMLFNQHPEKFFPYTQIDVVYFPEGPGADVFTEKIFKGPLNLMIRDVLAHIDSMFLFETVRKIPRQAEAERCFNYPIEAIEEALVNAVYHRDYSIREPVEVRITPESLTITSFPGPDRSITLNDLKRRQFVSQRYRNRRIGEFLKELELTEGRGTGIPKILRAIKRNGSPLPRFETNEERTFFAVRFPVHPMAPPRSVQKADGQLESQLESRLESLRVGVMRILAHEPMGKGQIATQLKQKQASGQLHISIRRLLADGLIERTIPDKPNSRLQKYRLTEKGRRSIAVSKSASE